MNNFLRVKCSGAKNFFPLPNAIFSLGLSTGELAVYAYLMYCEDRKSHQCWPSYKTIGQAVGMSRNTVQKYVRELQGADYYGAYQVRIWGWAGSEWQSYFHDSAHSRGNRVPQRVPVIEVSVFSTCEGRVGRFGPKSRKCKRQPAQSAVAGHLWRFVRAF